jgi:hypothetical protein
LPEDKLTLKKLIDKIEDIFIPDDTLDVIMEKMMSLERSTDKHEGENSI